MKREWSASTRNRSSSRGFPLNVHLMEGAGVPDTSQTRVVGCPLEVNTLGSPTSSTGAGRREGGEGYITSVRVGVWVLTEETCSTSQLDPSLLSIVQTTKHGYIILP